MEVVEESFLDEHYADDGSLEFHYSGVVYRLIFPDREYYVRRYSDTPGEASFQCFVELPYTAELFFYQRRLFRHIPYDDVGFREAARYVRDVIGASKVLVFLSIG